MFYDEGHEDDRCGTCRYYGGDPVSDFSTSITPVCSVSGRSQVLPVLTATDDAVCLSWEGISCERERIACDP